MWWRRCWHRDIISFPDEEGDGYSRYLWESIVITPRQDWARGRANELLEAGQNPGEVFDEGGHLDEAGMQTGEVGAFPPSVPWYLGR